MMSPVIVLAVLATVVHCRSVDSEPFALPEGMLIGAGVSAFQTEGAWNVSGKSESAVDYVLHLGRLGPMGIAEPHAHDVAANSYYRYKEDIAMAAKLKLSLYRFSISWCRVLPDANASNPNPEGVQYYHDFIDEILRYNMTPMATLHHFDHPHILEEQFKGWQGEEMVAKFKEYARFTFREYGGKVKHWATLNEPNMYCLYFPTLYRVSNLYTDSDVNRYVCMRNAILAHAEAYHVFKEDGHDGLLGFTALITPARPNSTRWEDVYTAEAYNDLQSGLALNPVVNGDWPQNVKDLGGSKVPPFSAEEQERIKGTADFLGFNVYYTMTATYTKPDPSIPPRGGLFAVLDDIPFGTLTYDALVGGQPMSYLFYEIEPEALRMAIVSTWQKYHLPLVVTENGLGDAQNLGLHDTKRAAYHSAYLRTLVQTVKDYDVQMVAYCVWSVIDAFEWGGGYSRPFGLVHIDYENGSLNRTLKDSSSFWIEMAETGVVPFVEDPDAPTVAPPVTNAPSTAVPPSTPVPSSSDSVLTASRTLILVWIATCLML